MTRVTLTLLVALASAPGVGAQDTIIFYDRAVPGDRPMQTLKATVDSESLAGIRAAGRFISSVDIISVAYEPPGLIRLDLPNAINAEAAGRFDDAFREYTVILGRPAVSHSPKLARHLSYRIAALAVAKSDGSPDQEKVAVTALRKFIADNPDSWQRVAATRQLAWVLRGSSAGQSDQLIKLYEELGSAATAPQELKVECALGIVDLLFASRAFEKARKVLATISVADPRVAPYQAACQINPAQPEITIAVLEEALAKSDKFTKATVYNLIGDCQRLDARRTKDALFSYLWVDVVYNHDPVENLKAQHNLAELFHELNDEARAKAFRDKLRGR